MINCNDKIKQRCKKVFSACTMYEKDLPEFSSLTDCISIEDTTEELYELVGEIREDLNYENIDFECLTEPSEINTNSLFQLLITKICELESTITSQGDLITTMQTEILELQENECP